MKKTKKILGLLGLVIVVITTIFAALLPNPEASAVGTTSVTDTIVIQVVGNTPDVKIVEPKSEGGEEIIFVSPNQEIGITWEKVASVSVELTYTDKDGAEHNYILDQFEPGDEAGSANYNLDLLENNYGYGEYVITVAGVSDDGVRVEDKVQFYLYPVIGEAKESEDDESINLNLDYDTEGDSVNTIIVNIYDENGDIARSLSPIEISSPTTQINLPFSDKDLPTGNYYAEVIAYDQNGEALYLPYIIDFHYESSPVVVPVPNTADTGMLLIDTNVSRTDYLITSLIVFLIVSTFGIMFVIKDGSKKRMPARRCRR